MNSDRNGRPDGESEDNGILAEAGIDTTAIGILGTHTSQVHVVLPQNVEDPDDDVVDDDLPGDDLRRGGIVIELPTEEPDDLEVIEGEIEGDVADAAEDASEDEPAGGLSAQTGAGAEHASEDEASAEEPGQDISVDETLGDDAPTEEDGEPVRIPVAAEAGRDPRPAHDDPLPSGYESVAVRRRRAGGDPQESVGAAVPEAEPPAARADIDEPASAGEDEDMSDSTQGEPSRPPITRPSFIEQAAPAQADAGASVVAEPASRRVGDVNRATVRESADVLTADRLLDSSAVHKPEPEGPWRQLIYRASGRLINPGDGKRTRERKELTRRIAAPLSGAARFVPVLSRKGGVGKTTVTAVLGMALADARDDRVIAVDANPDRGTLAERIARPSGKTVRDLVRNRDAVHGYADMTSHVVRDETRLDVLASDTDPHVSEAFGDQDYRDVADVAAHYYSIVLTDSGTGIVHSVMGATLDLADQLIVVAGLSVDEARLASETLTWLESNGHADKVRDAVVVLNQSAAGAPLVRLDELDAHFRSRVRAVVRLPYDPQLATGSAITYAELRPATRRAARELAARVVEGLRQQADA